MLDHDPVICQVAETEHPAPPLSLRCPPSTGKGMNATAGKGATSAGGGQRWGQRFASQGATEEATPHLLPPPPPLRCPPGGDLLRPDENGHLITVSSTAQGAPLPVTIAPSRQRMGGVGPGSTCLLPCEWRSNPDFKRTLALIRCCFLSWHIQSYIFLHIFPLDLKSKYPRDPSPFFRTALTQYGPLDSPPRNGSTIPPHSRGPLARRCSAPFAPSPPSGVSPIPCMGKF